MSSILNETTVTETNPAAAPNNGQEGTIGPEGAARCAPTTETQPAMPEPQPAATTAEPAATPVGARCAAPEQPGTIAPDEAQPAMPKPQPAHISEEAYPLAERQRRLRAAIEKIEAKSLEILERRLDAILARQRKEPEMKLTNADLQTVKLVRVVVRVLAMTVGVHVPLVPPKTPHPGPLPKGEGARTAPAMPAPQPAATPVGARRAAPNQPHPATMGIPLSEWETAIGKQQDDVLAVLAQQFVGNRKQRPAQHHNPSKQRRHRLRLEGK